MLLIASKMIPAGQRIYHRENCIYAKRIHEDHRILSNTHQAEKRGYCECSYCRGLKGDVRCSEKAIRSAEKRHHMKVTYVPATDTVYFQTEIGFWKAYRKPMAGYLLYHANEFDASHCFDWQTRQEFHRQCDVAATDNLMKLIEYIAAHDKAKIIIAEDYRKLPRQTKKQQMYYRKAERKDKWKGIQRVNDLFAMLEAEKPEYRQLAIV